MSLSNYQIEDRRWYDVPLNGIFMRDELKHITPKDGFYIVNLDLSTGLGNHWTSFFVRKRSVIYFDSFGAPSPPEVKECIKVKDQNLFNNFIIQHLKDDCCGWYSIGLVLYIKHYFSNSLQKTVNDYINLFNDDTTKNVNVLKIYFSILNLFTH